ncbi:S53 family peptidase, partial [Chthonomonas sp.]|uniref:S53 family peptidase n=1 Tax=Chthonomonas sp. TaxID=2282153 RepID=UPI002B4B0624
MRRVNGDVKGVLIASLVVFSLTVAALVAGVSVSTWSSPRFSTLQGLLGSTGMVELNGSVPYIPQGAVQLSADLNLAQNITVFLGFNTVNNALLDQFLQGVSSPSSPIYGHYLSHDTFMEWFEPNESTYNSVATYYESHGLSVLPSNDRLYMGLEGSILNVESAFNTTFALYNTSLGVYYFNIKPIYVPSSFAGVVSSAIGFTDYPYFIPQLLVNPASNLSVTQALNDINNGFGGAASPQPPYTPYALYKAYDELSLLDAGYQGQFETVAVTDAYGDPTASTDMATYDALYNVSAPASFQVLYPYGTPNIEGTLTQYENAVLTLWEVESALDFELAHAFAPQANIVSVVSPDAGYTLIQSLVYVITNHLADVVSNSWGAPEPEVGEFITYVHPFFKMA